MDAAVGLIRVEGVGIGGAESGGGGGLPGMGEAVDAGQFVDGDGGAQLGEQPAPSHRLELGGVASRNRLVSAKSTRPAREAVPTRPASSTISVAPGGSR